MFYKSLLKPLLFQLNAESAHEAAIKVSDLTSNSTLFRKIASDIYGFEHPSLEREFFGLKFPNPVGLAAGFDKNGVAPKAMQSLGFGFVEMDDSMEGKSAVDALNGNEIDGRVWKVNEAKPR